MPYDSQRACNVSILILCGVRTEGDRDSLHVESECNAFCISNLVFSNPLRGVYQEHSSY